MDNSPYNNPKDQPNEPDFNSQQPDMQTELQQPVAPAPTQPVAPPPFESSTSVDGAARQPRSRLAALLLTYSLGVFGVHRFYLGDIKQGRLRLILGVVGILTSVILIGGIILFGLFIWAAIDFFRLAFGTVVDGEGQPLLDDERDKKWSKTIGIVICVVVALYIAFFAVISAVAFSGILNAVNGLSS